MCTALECDYNKAMTNTTYATDRLLLPIARQVLKNMRKVEADYAAEVEEFYTEGDGRRTSEGGRGYTFPHCIHGTSRWTDYDNICGGCEEGLRTTEAAVLEALSICRRMDEYKAWLDSAPSDLPADLRTSLINEMFSDSYRIYK